MYNRQNIDNLVGGNFMLRDFVSYRIIFMNVCFYIHCHCNAVKGFWALWDNACDCVTALDFTGILDGQFTCLIYKIEIIFFCGLAYMCCIFAYSLSRDLPVFPKLFMLMPGNKEKIAERQKVCRCILGFVLW
jgi:hypothetical protein